MTPSAWVLVAYLIVVVTAVAGAAVRSAPTALRGASLWRLTAIAAVLWSALLIMTRHLPPAIFVVGVVAALALAFAARSRWLIVHAATERVDADVAGCARRLLLPCVPGERGLRIESGSMALLVHRRSLGAFGAIVGFSQAQSDRRLDLFRSLLGKQYRTAVPLPAIRL